MKVILKNIGLVVVLSVVFSALTGCQKDATAPNATAPASNSASAPSSKDAYPPVPAPIMKAENKLLDGSTLKLEDRKGKIVLVNLWATWCGPCRAEMPHLVELQDKYRDKGFEVIGLDVDPETKEEIEDFAKEMKLNYTLGWADRTLTTEIMKLNKMDGIPQTILINRNGELTGIFRGGGKNVIEKMKETVDKIVGQ